MGRAAKTHLINPDRAAYSEFDNGDIEVSIRYAQRGIGYFDVIEKALRIMDIALRITEKILRVMDMAVRIGNEFSQEVEDGPLEDEVTGEAVSKEGPPIHPSSPEDEQMIVGDKNESTTEVPAGDHLKEYEATVESVPMENTISAFSLSGNEEKAAGLENQLAPKMAGSSGSVKESGKTAVLPHHIGPDAVDSLIQHEVPEQTAPIERAASVFSLDGNDAQAAVIENQLLIPEVVDSDSVEHEAPEEVPIEGVMSIFSLSRAILTWCLEYSQGNHCLCL